LPTSSMSTGLNALSGVLVEDLFARWVPARGIFGPALWLRVAALTTGLVCISLVLVVEHLGGVLQVFCIFVSLNLILIVQL
jgi:hypothetical protein